jgi:phosphatidylglycerophosphate synthase
VTVPNVVASVRLAGAPALILLAAVGRGSTVLILFLFLELTDWLDGRLAALLNQRSTFGAHLDSIADLVMYASFLAAIAILEGRVFLAEWPWMVPAVAGYALSWSVSLVKFGKFPSYHTWSAKASSVLAVVSGMALLAAGEVRPLRITAVAVTLANLEAVALTLRLDSPREDIPSVLNVRRR